MNVLSDIHDGLRSEWSVLESQWRSTRNQWNDAVADLFEKDFWHELEDGIPTFLRELEHVNETLDHALRALDR
jgi:uncharacterized protein YlxP (DUF503 family)